LFRDIRVDGPLGFGIANARHTVRDRLREFI